VGQETRVDAGGGDGTIHPLLLRILHWINAFAVIAMILSGWKIYNASPLFGFAFPPGFTLGGWLAGALAWHFAAMWLLSINPLAYLVYGVATGHFARRLLPLWPRPILADLRDTLAGRAVRVPGRYNGAQRVAYVFAILSILAAIVSGLAIWKPVQLRELTAALGGFETARRVHFFAMAALTFFIVLHVGFALGVKGVLSSMVTGRPEAGK
jgi:thiosulfate reductase cytochrome b subunit